MNKGYPDIKQSVFLILGYLLNGLILVFLFKAFSHHTHITHFGWLIIYCLSISGVIVYSITKKEGGISQVNYTPKQTYKFLLLLGLINVIRVLNAILLHSIPFQILDRTTSNAGVIDVFVIIQGVIAAPICEEVLFRGIILDNFLKKYSPIKSIVISSILFALIHLNIVQGISIFCGGLFLGWVYYRTRSLLFCVFIHFTNNVLYYLETYCDVKKIYISYAVPWQLTFLLIVFLLSTLVFVFYLLVKSFKKLPYPNIFRD